MARGRERMALWLALAAAVVVVVLLVSWVLSGSGGSPSPVPVPAVEGATGPDAVAEESALREDGLEEGWLRDDSGGRPDRLVGRVVLAVSGEPVVGADVRAAAFRPRMEGYELFRLIDHHGGNAYKELFDRSIYGEDCFGQAYTDAEGRFVLEGLKEPRFFIVVESPAGYQVDYPWLDLEGGAGREEHRVLLVPGARLQGVVRDVARQPVAGAEVELFSPMNPMLVFTGEVDGFRRWQTYTDAGGRFTFAALPLDRPYTMTVSATGFARHVERTFPLTEARLHEREIVLASGGRIAGLVEDADGRPVGGAHVIGLPMGPGFETFLDGVRQTYSTQTDAGGRFVLEAVPPSRYRMYFRALDHITEVVRGVEVEAGVETPPLRVRLERGETITGTVVDDLEQPVRDARVRAMRPRVPGAMDVSDLGDDMIVYHEDRTDAEGRFLLEGLSRGAWNLDVQSTSHGNRTETDVQTGTDVTIVMQRRGGIRGRVVDDEGQPVTRFRILTRRGFLGIREEPHEDPDGRFEVEGLAEGRYQLTFEARGHATGLRMAEVPVGAFAPDLEVVLEAEAEVRGLVLDALTREPVAGAEVRTSHRHELDAAGLEEDFNRYGVSLKDMPTTPFGGPEDLIVYLEEFATVHRVRTDPAGRFHLRGLPRAPLRLEVLHPAYEPAVRVDLPLDQRAVLEDLVVEMDSGGAITGNVQYDDGFPVVSAMVVARHALTGTQKQSMTTEAGDYEMRGLTPGVWTVLLMDMNLSEDDDNLIARMLGRLQPALLKVPDGEVLRHDIVVPRMAFEGATLTGVVTSLGEPLDHGMITLAQGSGYLALLSGRTRTGRVEVDGRYQVEGVAPGQYEVRYSDGRKLAQGVRLGDFDIPDQPQVVLDLKLPVGNVRGRVVQGAERGGVVDAEVRLVGDGQHPLDALAEAGRDSTDDGGAFLLARIPAGSYRLVLSTGGPTERNAPFYDLASVVLAEGQDLDLGTLVVDQGGAIAGQVTDTAGLPVPGVVVRFFSGDGNEAATWYAFTAKDGRYRRPGLASGVYDVEALAEPAGSARASGVAVESGVERWVPLQLRAGVDVKVQVQDEQGQGVGRVRVLLQNSRGESVQSEGQWMSSLRRALTGGAPSGVHEFRKVPSGPWRILVLDGTATVASREVTVSEQQHDFTVRLAEQEPP